ncbi:hypothetical protein WN48_11286 [Eufriesea mexicana]|uniref:Uncharacterized protein n=1 Tax=Eufriesea mexicana TaxID=516756 RepID=A0A310S6N4_9HYME|nr:hypothetical protein WN48_11286 [Eufriesea mexicana]
MTRERLIPEVDWDPTLFREVVSAHIQSAQSEFGSAMNCGCGESAFKLPYDEFLTGLLKWRMGPHPPARGVR